MAGTVAIVGSGLIGRAWSIAFARAGCAVRPWIVPGPEASSPLDDFLL
jgi:L-gulonate 3-dehydrogenase